MMTKLALINGVMNELAAATKRQLTEIKNILFYFRKFYSWIP